MGERGDKETAETGGVSIGIGNYAAVAGGLWPPAYRARAGTGASTTVLVAYLIRGVVRELEQEISGEEGRGG